MTAISQFEHEMTRTADVGTEQAWQAVVDRDRRFAGRFVYAVRSTGVYCRPGCASRRPRRDNVLFFRGPTDAEARGFRPCQRCRPSSAGSPARDVTAVERACRYLERHLDRNVPLSEVAGAVKLSPYHLQRTFRRVMGLSPREFVEVKRADMLRAGLRRGHSVSQATYAAGYGSSRPVYERSGSRLGMTPAEYRRGARGLSVSYTIVGTALGQVLVAMTERGVCSVRIADRPEQLEATLREEFPEAELSRRTDPGGRWVQGIVRFIAGESRQIDVPLDIQATAFQAKVWSALRDIPYGATSSYGAVARAIGQPGAVRAVANACASNPVALVIPCHRVVRGDGDLGGYRWGLERKRRLLQQEREGQGRD